MKKFIAPLLAASLFSVAYAGDTDLAKEVAELKKQMAELKAAQEKINVDALRAQISEVKAHDANDNIKFSADLRTAYDYVDYDINGAESETNGIWSNRLILNMAAQPTKELIFMGALQVNKLFGTNQSTAANGFQNFDWYASETPDDNIVRLREAYFIYFGEIGKTIPYTASFGRRPAINGMVGNLRENDEAASPIAHNINMEFDGASFKFDLDKVTGISGQYFKLCMGRGNSNADGKYGSFTGYPVMGGIMPSATNTPYVQNDMDAPNLDMLGIMAQLYDNGQYKVLANFFKAYNVMGADFGYFNGATPANGYSARLTDVGDMSGGAIALQVDGIGDEISDFLDNTTAFASFAWSITDPNGIHDVINPMTGMTVAATEMLGSQDKETGTSYYVGVQMPCLLSEDGRLGLEYNHGSKYWRSFTYGEDTLAGSKLAARGDAYEIYWTKPLVGKYLDMQLRYTYIDYDYTGSDMFFGSTGTPMDVGNTPGAVESASSARAYLRYRY